MKLPSSSGVTMTTESCSFSSKWTCDEAPAAGGSSEKRTPPAFAQPEWEGRGESGWRSNISKHTKSIYRRRRGIKLWWSTPFTDIAECAAERSHSKTLFVFEALEYFLRQSVHFQGCYQIWTWAMQDYMMWTCSAFQLIGTVKGHMQAYFSIKRFREEKYLNNSVGSNSYRLMPGVLTEQ